MNVFYLESENKMCFSLLDRPITNDEELPKIKAYLNLQRPYCLTLKMINSGGRNSSAPKLPCLALPAPEKPLSVAA